MNELINGRADAQESPVRIEAVNQSGERAVDFEDVMAESWDRLVNTEGILGGKHDQAVVLDEPAPDQSSGTPWDASYLDEYGAQGAACIGQPPNDKGADLVLIDDDPNQFAISNIWDLGPEPCPRSEVFELPRVEQDEL